MVPAETSASARPSPTARAAWTIEASGLERTALTGLLAGLDRLGGVHDLGVRAGASPSSAAGPNSSTGTPERRAPSATAAGPRSAPFASTAITGLLVVGDVPLLHDDLTAGVGAAVGADAMREAWRVAARAVAQARGIDLVLGATLVGPRVGLSLLGNGHGGGEV